LKVGEPAALTTVIRETAEVRPKAAPVRYVAELIGADVGSERAIRWLIVMLNGSVLRSARNRIDGRSLGTALILVRQVVRYGHNTPLSSPSADDPRLLSWAKSCRGADGHFMLPRLRS
jgi:hypothetical protein